MIRILTLAVCLMTSAAFAEEGMDLSNTAPAGGGHAGKFGLRAHYIGGFGGNALDLPVGGAAPAIHLKYFAAEEFALNFGLGLGMNIGGAAAVGFTIGAGLDAYIFGGSNFKPFLTGGLGLGKTIAVGTTFGMSFNAGGGAEYWFNEHFSVDGRALLVITPTFGTSTSIATVQPGVGATFYF